MRHVRRSYVVCLVLAWAVILGTSATRAAAANLIANGGFETPTVRNKNGSSDALLPRDGGKDKPFIWTIGGDSIALVGNFWVAAESSQSIDLNGKGAGSISQDLNLKNGYKYQLSFKYSSHPDRSASDGPPQMTVRWNEGAATPYVESFRFGGHSTKQDMAWIAVDRTIVAGASAATLSFTSDVPTGTYGVALDAVSVVELGPVLATPVLLRAVATGGDNAFLIGRVDNALSIPMTIQAYACARDALTGAQKPNVAAPLGSPVAVSHPNSLGQPIAGTDGDGYFNAPISGAPSGTFVAIAVTTPAATATSECLASSADNDTWPKALDLGAILQGGDYLDVPGRARWYKFAVLPGQRINIRLKNLPADFDLAVFKDIGAAFLNLLPPKDPVELTKLSAEYAPSVFSPSVFSPSVFSPSVFSPDAYAPSVFSPSVFSPSVFSPSVFSPSVFSPSVFSPSVFSPSVFSPSVFSPSVFSPSVFSPSVFSPSVFSPNELALAFSSAQTRSIIGVSATPGTGDELVVVNSWSNTGSFYIRVAGKGGAFSTGAPFSVAVTKTGLSCDGVTEPPPGFNLLPRPAATATGIQTVILTDTSRVVGDPNALLAKLNALAASAQVKGVVVDVNPAADARVGQYRDQADAHAACPYAKNLLAEEIKGIVDAYRGANPGLKYVVIAGNDNAIPFFRYPDESLLGQESGYVPPLVSTSASEASLRRDFVLGQDAYGSTQQLSLLSTDFPIPGLAVGRLVETPAEMAGLLDAYMGANGVTVPHTSLVTGYDFLQDAADAVISELQQGTGAAPDRLVTPNGTSPQDGTSWTAAALRAKLNLGARYDVMFLAGHFSANSLLAADFSSSVITTELAGLSVDLKNSIVFSAGCHSGYNLVDTDAIDGVTLKLDWAQAFAQKQATLVAGTGYQYGDTDFLEYSERLYRNFAAQLRAGSGPVAVGEALMRAKRDYLATTPDIRGLHQKALLEATLFGLPMLQVDMPAGRTVVPITAGVITPVPVASGPAATLGLKTYSLTRTTALASNTRTLNVLPAGGTVTAQ
ncbi:MAG: DUF642 domain-containing protein, partial [Casimicrobiaceae bacterium]